MLIPSIDLMNGKVVQLQQGERLAIESGDLDGWLDRFAGFPLIQVIDLDAAMGRGHNAAIVADLASARPCQIGGGVRTVDRARALFDSGASKVILGSSLFTSEGANLSAARAFASSLPVDRLIGAIDSRAGRVTIHGWKTSLQVTPEEAARGLQPYVGAFLYTHVDDEGMLTGLNMDAVTRVAAATTRKIIAAGGIKSLAEVDTLDALGIDAVVGMAIYTGTLNFEL